MITKRIDARIEATQASGFWDVRRQLGFSYLWITALMLYNDHPSAPLEQQTKEKEPNNLAEHTNCVEFCCVHWLAWKAGDV